MQGRSKSLTNERQQDKRLRARVSAQLLAMVPDPGPAGERLLRYLIAELLRRLASGKEFGAKNYDGSIKGWSDFSEQTEQLALDELLREINDLMLRLEQPPKISDTVFMDAASARTAAAEILSQVYPAEAVSRALEDLDLAANAAREMTDRAPAEPRAPEKEDRTLRRLQQRYDDRLASIELPTNGFETVEQARAGGRLSQTYRDLNRRMLAHGLEPVRKDSRVVDAERLCEAFYRNVRNATL